jgi:hypothetical protein
MSGGHMMRFVKEKNRKQKAEDKRLRKELRRAEKRKAVAPAQR